jgi:hypothetical protein
MNFIDSATKKASSSVKKFLGKHNLFFSFLTNSLIQRWSIAIFLCLILSIILAPEIQFFAPKYKIGMISPKDIKADRDFLSKTRNQPDKRKWMPEKISSRFMITIAT